MVVTMDQCAMMAIVGDACLDDVKATIIKEKEIKHMSIVYGDFNKPKSNPDLCINPTGVPS